MPWFVLILSAVFEAVWATALGLSDGFSKPIPSLVFAVGLALSMAGLGYAMKSIPISTAYAVWTGLGAALTVGYAMATGAEAVSVLKIIFLLGIVACVIGLKIVRAPGARAATTGRPEDGQCS